MRERETAAAAAPEYKRDNKPRKKDGPPATWAFVRGEEEEEAAPAQSHVLQRVEKGERGKESVYSRPSSATPIKRLYRRACALQQRSRVFL